MEEHLVLNKDSVKKVLDLLRKPNGNKKSNAKKFEDVVPVAWKKLGLKGNPSPVDLEKLLINLILKLYDVENAEDIEEKPKIAQKRDFSLLSFGLLDGYYHTEEKNGQKVNIPSEERYERYLNDGYFIEFRYSDEGSYQDIKIKDKNRNIIAKSAQPRPLNNLTKIAGECKDEIAKELLKLIKEEKYKQYIDKSQGTDNTDTPLVLPKPCYTLKNFPPKVSESESESDPTDNPSRDDNIAQEESDPENSTGAENFSVQEPEEDPYVELSIKYPIFINIKMRPWQLKMFIVFIITIIVSVCGLSILVYNHIITPPPIEKINVKTNILVHPGSKEDLELDVDPDEADWTQLNFKINNKDIVDVTDDWWAVGLDGLGDKEFDNTSITIWSDGEAEPVSVDVVVEKPGNRVNFSALE